MEVELLKTVIVATKRTGITRTREEVVTGTAEQIGAYLAQVTLDATNVVTVTVRAVTTKHLYV